MNPTKRAIIRYGAASAIILTVVNVAFLIIMGAPGPDDFGLGEIIGYTTIVVALVPVFFAIKYYRDQQIDGRVGFWTALGIGTAVAVWPSVAFAIYNWFYVEVIDPEFSEKYMTYMLDKARADMSPAEFASYATQLESQSAMLTNPLLQSILMFLTVFLIGIVISFISALILQRRKTVERIS